ncbi:hypothetical protein E9230_003069 [Corynebacterium glutamicum]|nr:hypothetical protein [Corynebacterium glutamicum]
MSSLALSFGGAVLLVHGVTFIGVIQPRSEIPINLLAGGTLFLAAIPMVWTSIESSDTSASLYSAVGFALFGFTYLGVALGTSLSADNRGLGVYCGWAPVIAGLLVYVNGHYTLRSYTFSVVGIMGITLRGFLYRPHSNRNILVICSRSLSCVPSIQHRNHSRVTINS